MQTEICTTFILIIHHVSVMELDFCFCDPKISTIIEVDKVIAILLQNY